MSTPDTSSSLTHLTPEGRARMVDVSDKEITARAARAEAFVVMAPATLALIQSGQAAKGDVLAIAQIAGVMAAKTTSTLIPLCHPLPLSGIDLAFSTSEPPPPGCLPTEAALHVSASVRTVARTGVEMEALTAVSVAALTIYDMCKAVDRAMHIEGVRLVFKAGGRSGTYHYSPAPAGDAPID